MTMKVEKAYDELLSIIQDMLEQKPIYKNNEIDIDAEDSYGKNVVELYEDTLVTAGIPKQYIALALEKLAKNGVTKLQQIFYAPERTISNYQPEEKVKYTVPVDEVYKMPVYVLHIDAEKLKTPNPSEPLSFDVDTSILHYKGAICKIKPLNGIEYYILRGLFAKKPLGARVSEDDLASSFDNANNPDLSRSRVYDAHRRINTKAKEALGIEKLIGYENSTYWLNLSWPQSDSIRVNLIPIARAYTTNVVFFIAPHRYEYESKQHF